MDSLATERKRFPRLLTGEAAAALVSVLHWKPVFKVRLPKGKMSVVFSYKFSVPAQIPPEVLDLYAVLFNDRGGHWNRSLSVAKKKAEARRKRALGRVHNFLQSILTDAFKIWLFESWGPGADYRAKRKGHLLEFKTQSRLTPGTKPDPRAALLAAIRFRELDEEWKKILLRLKTKAPQATKKDVQIKEEISRSGFPLEIVRRSLAKIYDEGKGITFTELMTPGIRHGRIARAIVSCEMEDRGYDICAIKVDKYIKLGTRLLLGLSK